MATLAQLEVALKNADAAGDMDAARKLAAAVTRARQDKANLIPDTQVPETIPQAPEPTVGERVVGAGETALTLATGATGGALGMLGGTLKGLAEQILSGQFGTPEAANLVEQEAMKGARALTYAPRTAAGQEMAAATGEALAQTLPAIPLTAEMGALAAGTRAAMPAVQAGAQRAAQPAITAAQKVAQQAREIIPGTAPAKPTPGTMGSMGAAGVDIATIREAKAGELPVPIKLTEGQKTRGFEQQRFERETAKLPEVGEPLRERFAQQNRQLQQNLDAFIDQTGAEAPDLRSIGLTVDKALRSRAARDKVEIRVAYADARKAPEAGNAVNPASVVTIGEGDNAVTGSVIDYLNSKPSGLNSTKLVDDAKSYAVKLGIAEKNKDGTLSPLPTTVKTMEDWRREINGAVQVTDDTGIRDATILKKIIDAQVEPVAGPLYARARSLRAKYAGNYENIGVVKQLLGLKKGSEDRAIALEDVLRRSVIDPSTPLDSVRQVRRLLQTGGENGAQAWRELQGGTLRYIKDEALKSATLDATGNRILSPAQLDRVITQLDKTGKLDFVFGKKGAEQLRTINDVAKDVLTAPPGAVNTSNTATVLAGLMDVAISGTSGVPAPIMTSFRVITKSIKDARLKAKVRKTLGE